jgi:hypothetical protein
MIDKEAERCGTLGNLSHSSSDLVIKTPFKHIMGPHFNKFDDRERLQTIMSILRKEIDFEFFEEQGVIIKHYPLHKHNGDEFATLLKKEKYKLMWGFVFGGFHEHFQAVNYLKQYYGEKHAWQFAFFLHYQAWLVFPTIASFLFTVYQIVIWATIGSQAAFDNSLNGIFGIFVAVGSTVAIQSWKKKASVIRYYWGLDKDAVHKNNERVHEFKFNYVYNDVTGRKEKEGVTIPWTTIKFNHMLSMMAVMTSVGVVLGYFYLQGNFRTRIGLLKTELLLDEELNKLSDWDVDMKVLLSKNYSRTLLVAKFIFGWSIGKIGAFFKGKIVTIVNLTNHQYEQEYENDLIQYLFVFNSINAYSPLLLVAIMKNFFSFRDVYINVLIFLIKQFDANSKRATGARNFCKSKVDTLKEQFGCLTDLQKKNAEQNLKMILQNNPEESEKSESEDEGALPMVYEKVDGILAYAVELEEDPLKRDSYMRNDKPAAL